ncbi:hypothetical protein RBU61_01025 [Tissierella sp. MB52-C2]|jgi:hypothetical protein|uniref:hypothetical protein n=1 Tax=Tissierella sp. MB52-C2 TaxID=3070999 RepID=UPI00280B5FB7|nr:hypothetical protein [Tissierella sp. MB52-C2]WMM25274.1 hypothetical protein RBU61_01025 [Tissierella sp. MB52-C2]
MTKKPINENAMKAFEEMKLEIANELGYDPTTMANSMGITKSIAHMGEKEYSHKNKDTFNPS